jgi:hypothetical protein
MNMSKPIEAVRISAVLNGCATCSFLYRGIQKIETARNQNYLRQSSLFSSQELCNPGAISSQIDFPPLISPRSEEPYVAFRAAEHYHLSSEDTTLHVDLGTWEDESDESDGSFGFRIIDRVEFYKSPSESDSTQT